MGPPPCFLLPSHLPSSLGSKQHHKEDTNGKFEVVQNSKMAESTDWMAEESCAWGRTLGLKKLISTCYDNVSTHIVEESLFYDEDTNNYDPLIGRGAFKVVISKDTDGLDTLINSNDVDRKSVV